MISKDEFKNLIVYTSIFYQDTDVYKARSKIWTITCARAEKLGIKMIIKNNGVPETILNEIKKYKNVTLIDIPLSDTMGESRRQTLQQAIEIMKSEGIEKPIFLWTEPEKDTLITEDNLLRITSEINNGSNIVVPDRGEKAWQQLPKTQIFLEERAQKKVQKMLMDTLHDEEKAKLDIWFGPKAFDAVGAEYFLKYNSNKDKTDSWDALMVPVLDAVKDGKKVSRTPVDFLYNETQIKNETDELNKEIKIKRIEQYTNILKDFGDPYWKNFFKEANELKEPKQSLVNKFFKLK